MRNLFNRHPGVPADGARTYANIGEMEEFRALRDSGQLSFFREGVCQREACKKPCPKSKAFCSKKCLVADAEERKAKMIAEEVSKARADVDAAGEKLRETFRELPPTARAAVKEAFKEAARGPGPDEEYVAEATDDASFVAPAAPINIEAPPIPVVRFDQPKGKS